MLALIILAHASDVLEVISSIFEFPNLFLECFRSFKRPGLHEFLC